MAYGQKPKCCNNGCLVAKLRIGVCQTTRCKRRNRNNRRALNRYEAGEIPLNRNDRPLTSKGEEIV